MDIELAGMSAAVCGASQGIGKAVALEMARLGAQLTLIARNEVALAGVIEELPGAGHRAVVADFSDPRGLERALGSVSATILVNNTGGPAHGEIFAAELEEFERAFAQHVLCNQVLARHFVPQMKQSGYGRIVNVVSTSVRQPIAGLGVSNTIRAAVSGWAKTLSNELGPFGITVNNVLPGSTDTARIHELYGHRAEREGRSVEEVQREAVSKIPLRRLAKPEEIANAICFLASPAASYITGVSLPVDGGKITAI